MPPQPGDVERGESDSVLHLPHELGLHLRACLRVVVEVDQAELRPPAPPQKQLPNVLGLVVGERRLDAATDVPERLECGLAQFEDSGSVARYPPQSPTHAIRVPLKSRSRLRVNTSGSSSMPSGALASGPAIVDSRCVTSATDRPIGPTTAPCAMNPASGMRPHDGRKPQHY